MGLSPKPFVPEIPEIPEFTGVEMELLWENASPTSSFAAQTISLDLSVYDLVMLEFTASTTWYIRQVFISNIGGNFYYRVVDGAGKVYNRTCVINRNGIQFEVGQEGTSRNNDLCLPTKIYGVKGVQTA